MPIRRVITGQDAAGKARVMADDQLPDAPRSSIWAADGAPQLPSDGTLPPFGGPLLPMPGGLNILVLNIPPRHRRGPDAMHSTPSVDCMLQVSGESVFVLPDEEVTLRPGEWLISNGVVHDWRNDGDETSVLIGIVYGARAAI